MRSRQTPDGALLPTARLLEHGVDERREGRALGDDNENAEQEEKANDRQDPPPPASKEGKEFTSGSQVARGSFKGLHGT
jgi:hypothetical protein